MMPEDSLETLERFDAAYLGTVGWPTVPNYVSLWRLLLSIRCGFDQYLNLHPGRILRGVKSPLSVPGALDITVARENTEGEYSDTGGRMYRRTRDLGGCATPDTITQAVIRELLSSDRAVR
jgi:tartrate dehydrogenase/decarboxylase/D-malate dehydrogenase